MDFLHEILDFLVHDLGSLLRIRLGKIIPPCSGRIIERQSTDLVAHTIILDHGIGDIGKSLEIAESAGSRLAVDYFLGGTTSDKSTHLVKHI